jgi:hypothetical protein
VRFIKGAWIGNTAEALTLLMVVFSAMEPVELANARTYIAPVKLAGM